MEKIKTITVDGITYSVETDITDKADLVDGKVPSSQLPVSFKFTGAYNLGLPYAVGDVATYDGKTWYRINSNGGNVGDTPSEGNFWTLIAQLNAVDITGKADKVNGKLPESQLPSGVLFPKLIKANANDINFVSYLFDQENEFDIRLPQGFDPSDDGNSSGSFTIFFIPKESVLDDWSMSFTMANFGSGYGTPPLNRQQVAQETISGVSNFTVGYTFNPEGTSAYFYVHGSRIIESGNCIEVGSDNFSAFNGILTITSIYRGDFYIVQAI